MTQERPVSDWRRTAAWRLARPGSTAALLLGMAAAVVATARAGAPEAGIALAFVIIMAVLWLREQRLVDLGLRAPDSWSRTFLTALSVGVGAQLVSLLLVNPLIERLSGAPADLSAFEPLRGDLQALLTLLAFVWVVVVFVEEIVFRGFFITELRRVLGPGRSMQLTCVALPAILFGLAHWYQGISGILSTGLMGLLLGYLFLCARLNLWLPILTHGFLNTAGLLLVYLDADRFLELP